MFYLWSLVYSLLLSSLHPMFSSNFRQPPTFMSIFNIRSTALLILVLGMMVWWFSSSMGQDYERVLQKDVVGIQSLRKINHPQNGDVRSAEVDWDWQYEYGWECVCVCKPVLNAEFLVFGYTKIVHFSNWIKSSGSQGLINLSNYILSYSSTQYDHNSQTPTFTDRLFSKWITQISLKNVGGMAEGPIVEYVMTTCTVWGTSALSAFYSAFSVH